MTKKYKSVRVECPVCGREVGGLKTEAPGYFRPRRHTDLRFGQGQKQCAGWEYLVGRSKAKRGARNDGTQY